MTTIVEISKNAQEILALVQAAEKLQKQMDDIKDQTKKLDQQYDELLLMRDALHNKARAIHRSR